MRVLVSGASGLIGSAVVAELNLSGHQVTTLGRSSDPANNSVTWNPETKTGTLKSIEGLDAVIHLAGESIGNKRWSEEQKRKITYSRLAGTEFLIELLEDAQLKPEVFISASAIGYYGDRGNQLLEESSPKGEGFLADLVAKWEEKAQKASETGARVVTLRTGVVLSSYGGALSKQLPLFKYGLGAALGTGGQYLSWIHLEDEVRAILLALENQGISGAVNLVSEHPVTNLEFSKTIAKVLNRPMLLKVPKPVIELGLGKEFADELLLVSQRVVPKVLSQSGFEFQFNHLENALSDLLR